MEKVIFYPISCIGNPGSRQNAVGKSLTPHRKHRKHQLPAFPPALPQPSTRKGSARPATPKCRSGADSTLQQRQLTPLPLPTPHASGAVSLKLRRMLLFHGRDTIHEEARPLPDPL